MLTKKHPARRTIGAAKVLRGDISKARLFGSLPMADVATCSAEQVVTLLDDTVSDLDRIDMAFTLAMSDGVISADEADSIRRLIATAREQVRIGEVLP